MNRVREFRKALGMSQGALGEAAGTRHVQICRIETGKSKNPHIKTMKTIAEALGCSVSEAFPDAAPSKILLAQEPAETLSDSERLAAGNCRWCGRRNVKDELAALVIAGGKVYETGHLRCLADSIVENTDSKGNWKKHRNTGLR